MAAPRGRKRYDPDAIMVGTTGRFLVVLDEENVAGAMQALRTRAGVRAAATTTGADVPIALEEEPDAVLFPEIGVAVVSSVPERSAALQRLVESSAAILHVEPERYVHALPSPYASGYRDGVADLVARLEQAEVVEIVEEAAPFADTATRTWGLQATGADTSTRTGAGIKVAVLDTGLDAGHPDFAGRAIVTRSFVTNETIEDRQGHGTHCCGTSTGPTAPTTPGPRYGVAGGALLYVGKVLSNQGSGSDSSILAGINWAIANGCVVVSMSLGAPAQPGQAYSRVFETVARRALTRGTLIVAAAGNESSRPFSIRPVGHPANCPSILAVGALDPALGIAPFSCGGNGGNGGEVDLAAPGVAVNSAWPRPTLRNTISGTSMATPHVAGIAALWAETDPALRGRALWDQLTRSALPLPLPASDVGAGLVQAPQ